MSGTGEANLKSHEKNQSSQFSIFFPSFYFPIDIDRHRHKTIVKYLFTETKLKNQNYDFFHVILNLLGQFLTYVCIFNFLIILN